MHLIASVFYYALLIIIVRASVNTLAKLFSRLITLIRTAQNYHAHYLFKLVVRSLFRIIRRYWFLIGIIMLTAANRFN
jgi:hypothetical protein